MRTPATLSWLSVFASSSTLVCCALPAMMVGLGAGTALSGLVSAVPQLVWLSEHKGLIFGAAGLLLAASGLLQWRTIRSIECPADPALAAACATTRDISVWVWWLSVVIYAIGAFFAFLAPYLISQ